MDKGRARHRPCKNRHEQNSGALQTLKDQTAGGFNSSFDFCKMTSGLEDSTLKPHPAERDDQEQLSAQEKNMWVSPADKSSRDNDNAK